MRHPREHMYRHHLRASYSSQPGVRTIQHVSLLVHGNTTATPPQCMKLATAKWQCARNLRSIMILEAPQERRKWIELDVRDCPELQDIVLADDTDVTCIDDAVPTRHRVAPIV